MARVLRIHFSQLEGSIPDKIEKIKEENVQCIEVAVSDVIVKILKFPEVRFQAVLNITYEVRVEWQLHTDQSDPSSARLARTPT